MMVPKKKKSEQQPVQHALPLEVLKAQVVLRNALTEYVKAHQRNSLDAWTEVAKSVHNKMFISKDERVAVKLTVFKAAYKQIGESVHDPLIVDIVIAYAEMNPEGRDNLIRQVIDAIPKDNPTCAFVELFQDVFDAQDLVSAISCLRQGADHYPEAFATFVKVFWKEHNVWID